MRCWGEKAHRARSTCRASHAGHRMPSARARAWKRVLAAPSTSMRMASCVSFTGYTSRLRQVSCGVISRSTGLLGYLPARAACSAARRCPPHSAAVRPRVPLTCACPMPIHAPRLHMRFTETGSGRCRSTPSSRQLTADMQRARRRVFAAAAAQGAAPGRDLAGLQRERRARLRARDLIVLRGPRPAAARQHTRARRSLLAVQCR